MQKLLLGGILLALTAPVALAGTLNLNYGAGCWSDGTPLAAKTFACDTNTGEFQITASFIPAVAKTDWLGVTAILDGQTLAYADLPAWWQLWNTGSCRQAALTTSADFTSSPHIGCADPFLLSPAQGGIGAFETNLYPPPFPMNMPAPSRFRLKVGYGMVINIEIPGDGTEYYAFRATVNYTKTLGTGSCGGCSTPLTMVLTQIQSIGETSGRETITRPAANSCLTWQTAGLPCSAVPARNSTWGQVKSLYR